MRRRTLRRLTVREILAEKFVMSARATAASQIADSVLDLPELHPGGLDQRLHRLRQFAGRVRRIALCELVGVDGVLESGIEAAFN